MIWMKTTISQCLPWFHSRHTNNAGNSPCADVWAVLYCSKNRQCLSMIHSTSSLIPGKVLFITKVLKYTVEYSSTWRSFVWISFLVLLYCSTESIKPASRDLASSNTGNGGNRANASCHVALYLIVNYSHTVILYSLLVNYIISNDNIISSLKKITYCNVP